MFRFTKTKAFMGVLLLLSALFIGLFTRPTIVEATITGANTRIDLTNAGGSANQGANDSSISKDGRYVVFTSSATNLVAGDSNGAQDVFVRDRVSGTTTLASVSTGGTQANANVSSFPRITDDGKYVVFSTNASNLVAGDSNGQEDVFLHNMQSGATERISVTAGGTQGNGGSHHPDISRDGRYVVFSADATSTLAPGWVSANSDVYLKDRTLNTLVRVVTNSSNQTNGNNEHPRISADGAYITFDTTSTDIIGGDTNGVKDVYLLDRIASEVTNITQTGDGDSRVRSISSDGATIGFTSDATNLVAGDTNGYRDGFVYKVVPGTTERISVSTAGAQGNGNTGDTNGTTVVVSSDGNYAAFDSYASNLSAADANGGVQDVFLRDLRNSTTQLVSINSSGTGGYQGSFYPNITSDAKEVIYSSGAWNISPDSLTGILSSATGITDCSL